MSELALRQRDRRRLWAAPGSRHDHLIAALRVVLPAAIGALAALLALAPLTVGGDISFVLAKDKVAVAKERMRVSAATYRGEDSKGQPFAISAGSAVQQTSRDPVVRLNDLSAHIRLADGPAALTANQGRYDMDQEQVAIDGPILFESAGGYRLATRDVTVDLKTRRLASAGRVDGHMPLGTFAGDRLRADLPARIVMLDGRARLHIVQRGGRAAR